MKKFIKPALALAVSLVAASVTASPVAYEKNKPVNDNWGNGTAEHVWKNGTDELCWRDGNWSPATANAQCDGALAWVSAPEAPELLKVERKSEAKNFTLSADALFDFDKATLKAAGKPELANIVSEMTGESVSEITVIGHTDSFGSNTYNDRLSLRRASAVKAYLVTEGANANKITVDGKGKRELKVDPKSCKGNRKTQIACQQPNRRVEVNLTVSRNCDDFPTAEWQDEAGHEIATDKPGDKTFVQVKSCEQAGEPVEISISVGNDNDEATDVTLKCYADSNGTCRVEFHWP